MASIQWFPGHMNSARKKAAENMEFTDVVIEVVDARLPAASSNPMIEELRRFRQRNCLKLLNKADIADPRVTQAWISHYNGMPGVKAAAVSFKKASDVAKIVGWCRGLAPTRGTPDKQLRMMIMGIPNCGKSTLMNALMKRKVAAVGDIPAVTKTAQRLEIDRSTVIIDTPGLMWPKIAYPSDGYMLAASHAIGTNAVIDDEVAAFLGNLLLEHYPGLLAQRYGFDVAGLDGVSLIERIATRRAWRVRGGELDLGKAALALLKDYRTGVIGNISLETPERRAQMIAAAAVAEPVQDDTSPETDEA
ncbi:ribosome biogenesis GTPase YlqF [Uliginosibacterium sediminicola]|uniref:Ribosome biogenesis GTPase A n=1 Tax=Uliginosibacterium sediminicola TaxID=2024550 RepID=A0ABU9Z343_9RHOO